MKQQPSDAHQEVQETLDRIESSSDYYEVLGVDESADKSALRKAYLTSSVLIHPDKCSDERATHAFQKAALAYQVLSNDETRAEYDKKRHEKRNGDDYFADSSHGDTEYSYVRSPSYQDALFVFATVVGGAVGGGKTAFMSDVAQTLYWAQQWVQQQQQQSSSASRDGNVGNANARSATAAMALGSSLRVAGSAAKFLGFQKSAVALERTAKAAQVAGMGVMVADSMGVDVGKVLDHDRVKKLHGKVRSSVRHAMQKDA